MDKVPEKENYEDAFVKVCVRVRPFSSLEASSASSRAIQVTDGKFIDVYENGLPSKEESSHLAQRFSFDEAFDSTATQEEVFIKVGRPVVASSLSGFNNCIFAYGQTGSGKSYSMLGSGSSAEEAGIIPRLSEELFSVAMQKKKVESGDGEIQDIAVYASYMEIYMERVRCLLRGPKETPLTLKIRQHPTLGVYVQDLREVPVTSSQQLLQLLKAGSKLRRTSKTDMNNLSSRSHAIFCLKIIQRKVRLSSNLEQDVSEIVSKIHLVDLAGSECVKTSNAELKEGALINKSLTTLGSIINALATTKNGKQKSNFVPYRDSALTFILKDSLGGNAKTVMLATISPAVLFCSETLNTLRYANRAKSIASRAFVNETPKDKCIRELQEEVARLKDQIKSLEAVHESIISVAPEMVSATAIDDDDRSPPSDALFSEIHRAQELIKQHVGASRERELEALETLEEIQGQESTLLITRKEAYLLNFDSPSDWIIQHFTKRLTFISAEHYSSLTSELAEESFTIVIPRMLSSGVGSPHCCFIKRDDGKIAIKAFSGCLLFLNDEELVDCEEQELDSGDLITLGFQFLQFRLIYPWAPPLSARRTNVTSPRALSSLKRDSTGSFPREISRSGFIGMVNEKETMAFESVKEAFSFSVAKSCGQSPRSSQSGEREEVYIPHLYSKTFWPNGSAYENISSLEVSRSSRVLPGRHSGPSLGKHLKTSEPKVRFCLHNFVVIGPSASGKSHFINNLTNDPSWFSLGFFKKPTFSPTFGVQRTSLQSKKDSSMQIALIELGGTSPFSLLASYLPTSQATFILCFSLEHFLPVSIQKDLDLILSRLWSRKVCIILVGTHRDKDLRSYPLLFQLMLCVEEVVLQYFEAKQLSIDVAISGKFAVDNTRRSISTMGYASITKFSHLLHWMFDHANDQSNASEVYPNSSIPRRSIRLRDRIIRDRSALKSFISFAEFKKMAVGVSDSYYEDDILYAEATLLAQWGDVSLLRWTSAPFDLVGVDHAWSQKVLAVMSLCQPYTRSNSGSIQTEEVTPFNSYGPLLLSSTIAGMFNDPFPVDVDEVVKADDFQLLGHGVITSPVLAALFKKLKEEKPLTSFSNILQFLFHSRILIPFSKVLRLEQLETFSPSLPTVLIEGKRLEDEKVFLNPLSFVYTVRSDIFRYLLPFLGGPYFSIEFPTLSPKIFPSLVCHLSSIVSSIFIGPFEISPVSLTSPISFTPQKDSVKASCIPTSPRFWKNAVWLIGSTGSRAFLYCSGKDVTVAFDCATNDEKNFMVTLCEAIFTFEQIWSMPATWKIEMCPVSSTLPLGKIIFEEPSYSFIDVSTPFFFQFLSDVRNVSCSKTVFWDTSESNPPAIPFVRSRDTVIEDMKELKDQLFHAFGEKQECKSFLRAVQKWEKSVATARETDNTKVIGHHLDSIVLALSRIR